MAALFPIFCKLEGRRCVMVGAGTIASQKLEGLLAAGAEVHIVAPQAIEAIQELARSGRVAWTQAEFEPAHLDGAFLAIAATGKPEVNEQVWRAAKERGVLCNAVDDPERCDFFYPAVVRRGDLQIAISTAGKSPALAQRIRKELEEQFDASYGRWLDWLGSVRQWLFRRDMDPGVRKKALHRIAGRTVFERFKALKVRAGQLQSSQQANRGLVGGPEEYMGKVYLVGAGPGDPELLTMRAARLLREADIVLHDALVSAEVLACIGDSVKVIDIGKRCGPKLLTQEEINRLLVAYAAQHQIVVRLKSGDPAIFGRAAEEIETLVQAGVPFEIVPGVTSAIAGAAAAGISLTDRRFANSVTFASAHRGNEQTVVWEKLIAANSTLAIYMPGSNYESLARQLCEAGLSAETPCMVISHAGRSTQQVRSCNLASLPRLEALPAPSLLIVGECARPLHLAQNAVEAGISPQHAKDGRAGDPSIAPDSSQIPDWGGPAN
jgi:uroporphyrin-III C-methyltransferase / precorrin-2 dehydrogenase / sirohydrochlorin ferrochelatase